METPYKCIHTVIMTQRKNNIVDFKSRDNRSRGNETQEQALERLFNEHGNALLKFLLGRMGNHNSDVDVEDIRQDVFVRLAKRKDLDNLLPAGKKGARTYLYTTANNLIVDLERSKKIRRKHQDAARQRTDEHCAETPDLMVEGIQTQHMLEEAILKLPPTLRQVFVLNRFQFMSYKDIAVSMNLSVRTVEKYVADAVIKIRKQVKRAQEEGL